MVVITDGLHHTIALVIKIKGGTVEENIGFEKHSIHTPCLYPHPLAALLPLHYTSKSLRS